jgi:hypothetical protein
MTNFTCATLKLLDPGPKVEALLWIVACSRNLCIRNGKTDIFEPAAEGLHDNTLKFNTKVLLSVATTGIVKLLLKVWDEGG